MQRLTNHGFRHSRLTDFASHSSDVASIRHMAGHRDLASTMRYVHGALKGAQELLEAVDGPIRDGYRDGKASTPSGKSS